MAQPTPPEAITNEQIFRKLLVIESHLRGKGEDLLTPNQVRMQYRIEPRRLHQAVKAGILPKYCEGPARGGRESYMVTRADVIAAFHLPALPTADA